MDRKDWLVLPNRSEFEELGEEESYAKLLVLKQEAPAIIEQRRGRKLTEGQKRAIQGLIEGLIESKARIRYYQD